MIWFVRIFIVCGIVSLGLAITFLRVVKRQDEPASDIQTKGIRRAFLMTAVWFITAGTLHFCMSNVEGFVRGLPTQVLTMDVSHRRYGATALRTLTERIPSDRLTLEEIRAINDRVFANEHWWMPETAQGSQSALVAAEQWFRRLRTNDRLMQSDFRRWLELDPPPVLGQAIVVPGDGMDRWRIPIEFGRTLAVTYELPYEINAIDVVGVKVNGAPATYTMTLSPESEDPELRYFAHRIMYELVIEQVPDVEFVTVEFVLDIAPTGPEQLGPIARRVYATER